MLIPFLFSFIFLLDTGTAQVNESDSLSLVALYNQTQGDNWTVSWDINNTPVNEWFGISLNSDQSRVIGISLPNNQLSGNLPDSLYDIDHLRILNLSNNEITGSLETGLGNLDSLSVLNLSNNQLSDSIPESIGNLQDLAIVNLSRNILAGPIPGTIQNLKKLEILDLSQNLLSDSIPNELIELTLLNELYLYDNSFTGPLPQEIYKLDQLVIIDLSSNQLNGSIPDSIDQLFQLEIFDLSQNLFSGRIPDSIGSLDSLQQLNLSTNFFSDSIPTTLGNLINLVSLDLSNNQLSGEIPVDLGLLNKLETFRLNNNTLTGEFPVAITSLTQLTILNVSFNQLLDSIPQSIANLTSLTNLNLSNNEFTVLPDITSITSGGNSPSINVSQNYLTFEDLEPNISLFPVSQNYSPQAKVNQSINISIPLEGADTIFTLIGGQNNIYEWIRDTTLKISNENFYAFQNFQVADTGLYYCKVSNSVVPDLIIEREPIRILVAVSQNDRDALLSLYENTDGDNWDITWQMDLPVSLWHGITVFNERVTSINLSNNGLNGSITNELNALDQLRSLRLNNNQLSGTIPDSLTDLRILEIFDLSNNDIMDSIYHNFDSLESLKQLLLNDNLITGGLPENLGQLSQLTRLDISNNQLNGEINIPFDSLNALTYFNAANNRLSGNVPFPVNEMPAMINFQIDDNRLTGIIPPEISNFINLKILNMSDNEFTGTIPSTIGDLLSLEVVRLFGNRITGEVPESFLNLNNLSEFYINNNLIEDLPHLELNSLNEMRVFNNNLTFEDIIPNLLHFIGLNRIEEFLWEPQAQNHFLPTVYLQPGQDTLLVSPDKTVGNRYAWTKDGVSTNVDSSVYLLDSVDFTNSGIYNCIITNDIIDSLGFQNISFTYAFQIEVEPIDPEVAIPEPFCIGSSKITLNTNRNDPGLNTIWFNQTQSGNDSIIGTGSSLTFTVEKDLDTLFVVNKVGNLNSDTLLIPILLRPVIYQQDDSLLLSGRLHGVEYLWYHEDKLIMENRMSILPQETGNYYVQAIHSQCSSTSDPFFFSAEENGLITSSDQYGYESNIHIYPNPFQSNVIFEIYNKAERINVSLFDRYGKIILNYEFRHQNDGIVNELSLGHLASGIYLLHISTPTEKFTKRILKY